MAYDIVDDNSASAAGEYSFTLKLKEDFTWDDYTTEDITVSWRIKKAANYIKDLYVKRWEVGALPNTPTCDKRYGNVKYSYRLKSAQDIEENYSATPPAEEGEYILRAVIEETSNYDGAAATFEFIVFSGALNIHTDYVSFKTEFKTESAPLSDYPVRIVLKENSPYGFSHKEALVNGINTVRFYDSLSGEPLSYECEQWDDNGTSVFWVRVSAIEESGSEILIYWGLKAGKTPVNIDPESTWEKHSKDEASSGQSNLTGSFGLVTDALAQKYYNYFTSYPEMSKTDWYVSDQPGEVLSKGTLADAGTVTNYFKGRFTDETYETIPLSAGAYTAVFASFNNESSYPVEYRIDFIIRDRSPVSDIAGTNGDSGRILLMNDDKKEGFAISNQAYRNTDISKSTWWEYETDSDEFNPAASDYRYLKEGFDSRLRKMGGKGEILWNLKDCRHGNTFRAQNYGSAAVVTEENYLPWGSTSLRLANTLSVGNRASEVGYLYMRNTLKAAVYSKCFEDGIGTIYFDVVNQKKGTSPNTAVIEVSVATECVDGEEPTDENVGIDDEYGGYANARWEKKTPMVYRKIGSNGFELLDQTNTEIDLQIGNNDSAGGGDTNSFYRVCVPVNHPGKVRFKISRIKLDRDEPVDGRGGILIDNIIVSAMPMSAKLEPHGKYDAEKTLKDVIGYAGAFTKPFASYKDDIFGRAKLVAYTNMMAAAVDPDKFITSAKMHYRWRYLDQRAEPSFGSSWHEVDLNPLDGFKTVEKLQVPKRPGDVEFYFTGTVQAPYFEYINYSGVEAKIDYSEEVSSFRSGYNTLLESDSKARADWFVRLREGLSDYESLAIAYRFEGQTEEKLLNMELVKDHAWRGYLQTPTNMTGKLSYRIVMLNKQPESSDEFAVNEEYYIDALVTNEVPITATLASVPTPNEYSSFHSDSKTGYLMFQIDDRTKGLTVVHADYQNFNRWNDAASSEKQLFVGRHDEDEKKVGVSPTQREFKESYDSWDDMPKGSPRWNLSFPLGSEFNEAAGRAPYVSFAESSYNGWDIGPGMYVAQEFRKTSSGAALQMEGRGLGYTQYTLSPLPRGVESIKFNARIGQDISMDDFAWYDAGARERKGMTNYTFYAGVAFDGKGNTAYTGNASLSLLAHYTPGRGGYEARWEQIAKHGLNAQRLVIYKWAVDEATGKITEQEVAVKTNNVRSIQYVKNDGYGFENIATNTPANQVFLPMFVSVANANGKVVVIAGVRLKHKPIAGNGSDGDFTDRSPDQTVGYWTCVQFEDNSLSRFTDGTYGVASANCEAIFNQPRYRDAPVQVVYNNNGYKLTSSGYKTSNIEFRGQVRDCREEIEEDCWIYPFGRTEPYVGVNNVSYYGFKSSQVAQTLKVFIRDPYNDSGSDSLSGWKNIWTEQFNSFGVQGEEAEFSKNIYSVPDAQIRFEVGGVLTDPRVDIVIDDIEVTQFRGENWANSRDYVNHGVNSIGDHYYDLTNFTFSSAWIKDRGVRLSARRTTEVMPSSIRSPLMDGAYGRGEGLGKISFSYSNATENVKLLLQIATNLNYTQASSANLDVHNENIWHTVSNFTFSTSAGSQVVYVGLHGVSGMFRLVIDQNSVRDLAGETDESKFGEILITKISCTDEPRVNDRAWWGWNIRSVGQNPEGKDIDWEMWHGKDGSNAEGRTYLPDYSADRESAGLSMALNNSSLNPEARVLPDGVDASEEMVYRSHYPFVQSPTFTEDIVGEVSFKARKFDTRPGSKDAVLQIYGAKRGKTTDVDDDTWEALEGAKFSITNDSFETFTFKTPPGNSYSAFRFGQPRYGDVQRVILDELVVCEAVRANVKLRNVGAFRSKLSELAYVENVPSVKEQPLCDESWGIQCEVYAQQLPEEVDFVARPPRVFLTWYKGITPWGYENWKNLPNDSRTKNRVELMSASNTNLFYRSTNLGRGDSVIPMTSSERPGEVVQYMLEVVYYNKESLTTPITNRLDESMWRVPEWYSPVDYNRDELVNPAREGFAAFNILDTVAPDWAWINEVNVYGGFDNVTGDNLDAAHQYIEIAAPVEASLTGWQLRLLERADNLIVTNVAAVFGDTFNYELESKKDPRWSVSNMVFHVIANKETKKAGVLKKSQGTLDGVWSIPNSGAALNQNGEIGTLFPFAVQLVRPSGIIEHEIVAGSTNLWAGFQGYEENGDVDIVAAKMNEILRAQGTASNFIPTTFDSGPRETSISVLESHGEKTENWKSSILQTPGRINDGQQISEDHPTPNGEDIFIFSNLDYSLPHIRQTFGDLVNSNANTMIVIRKGSLTGTNITYHVDPWYDLANVATNGVPLAFNTLASPRTYTVEVGRGVSNNVTVVASATYSRNLFDAGLDPYDRYTPAILDWLSNGKDLYGNKWPNWESGEIHHTKVLDKDGNLITNLTLRAMYWLDIDPTNPNMYFKAYNAAFKANYKTLSSTGTEVSQIVPYMCISNDTPGSVDYWPPYVIRGMDIGSHSQGYSKESGYSWTNATFKVRAMLLNGKTNPDNWSSKTWVPLRWFVFDKDSFYPKGHERECQATIDILDPRSSLSPAWVEGWDKYPDKPITMMWLINTELKPVEVEMLNKESVYDN